LCLLYRFRILHALFVRLDVSDAHDVLHPNMDILASDMSGSFNFAQKGLLLPLIVSFGLQDSCYTFCSVTRASLIR